VQAGGKTYFSTLKMEAICSSETLVDPQWTTRRYIPEDGTLQRVRLVFRPLLLVTFSAYSLFLKMEAICSSETSGTLQTTLHYNPEDHGLLNDAASFEWKDGYWIRRDLEGSGAAVIETTSRNLSGGTE
jgi:hypothetical protein